MAYENDPIDDDETLFDYESEYDDLDPFDFYDECSMCGVERILNEFGRCSHCETIWNG